MRLISVFRIANIQTLSFKSQTRCVGLKIHCPVRAMIKNSVEVVTNYSIVKTENPVEIN
jgi:uncharacterized OsmC-like protein